MKAVIIGAGNIGFEVAKLFGPDDSVLLVSRNLPVYLKSYLKSNTHIQFLSGDATKIEDMMGIYKSELLKSFKYIDILICTVGTDNKSNSIDDFNGFQNCFNTNLFANIIPIKVFTEYIQKSNNGRFIILSSTIAHHAPKRLAAYSPSKWALENICSSLREEINKPVDVIAVRTIKNKYSKTWKTNHGEDPEKIARYIHKVIEYPKNKRHFIPKRYYFVRFTERLFSEIINFKYLKTFSLQRRIKFSRLKANSVLISGAVSGLGYELAKRYSNTSQVLYLIDKDYDGLVTIKKELELNSKSKIVIKLIDLQNQKELEDYLSNFNEIDLIINNAAISYTRSIFDMTIETYKSNFEINFLSQIFIISFLLKHDIPIKKVINILSTSAIRGRKDYGPYSSAKAAFWSWTKSFRRLYGNNIQVLEVILSRITNTNYYENMIKPSTLSKPKNAKKVEIKKKKSDLLEVKNWTANKASKYIRNYEKSGREILFIPPIKAKLFLLIETISNKFFNTLFDK